MKKLWMTGTLVLALAACTTVAPYHPAITLGGSGFSDEKLDETHYVVTFQGDSRTSRHEVEDYLLFRAAELTDDNGYDYFVVSEKDISEETTIIPPKPPLLGSLHDRHRHGEYNYPFYVDGYDWKPKSMLEADRTTRYSASVYINMFYGAVPEENIHAFDASTIMDALGPIDCWKVEIHDEDSCRLDHSE